MKRRFQSENLELCTHRHNGESKSVLQFNWHFLMRGQAPGSILFFPVSVCFQCLSTAIYHFISSIFHRALIIDQYQYAVSWEHTISFTVFEFFVCMRATFVGKSIRCGHYFHWIHLFIYHYDVNRHRNWIVCPTVAHTHSLTASLSLFIDHIST